ncbi:Uncharacterised protein [Salmonella enterica subsp. arizonae]|uniref:Uncharacterized protein n=1 Tax=Salmonella enterica subsp. arizonae TaxID=59203 RepID=A0A447R1R3_SALER|nr:Uncharacterised protein [Salmonella enterica subsp. arizonae]
MKKLVALLLAGSVMPRGEVSIFMALVLFIRRRKKRLLYN